MSGGTHTIVTVMSIVAALGVLGWILFAFKIGPSYNMSFQVSTVKVRRETLFRSRSRYTHTTLLNTHTQYIIWWSIITGAMAASVGCYGFYFSLGFGQKDGKFNPSMLMISLYMVLFGLLGFAAECKIRSGPLRKFQILASRGGRGCAAIFIGSIAMSVGWQFADESDHVYWICVAGMYDVVVGFLLLLSYTCVST